MACSHQALSSSGGGDVQEVDFQEVDTAQDVNFSHPSPQLTLYGTKEGGGAGQVQGQIQQEGAPEGNRSWLSFQALVEGPGPGYSCMAKGLSPAPELPPGGPCTVMLGRNPTD